MSLKHLFAVPAMAISAAAWAGNAAPMGLELGIATVGQVQKEIGGKARLEDGGTNKFSGGRMLKGDGEGLGIEGLSEIVFVFDAGDRLAGVVMTLPKGPFNDNFRRVMAMLDGKYRVAAKRVPSVGDSYAKYRQGDSVVELDAPHLSFEMSLRYLTDRLLSDFEKKSAAEKIEKRRRQASQF